MAPFSLILCPLYPIGTDFSRHLQWLADAPVNSSSLRVWIENNLQWYSGFALATGWTFIRRFCPRAHYRPKIRVLLMNLQAIRSISEFSCLTVCFVSIGFCITRAFSYKITHNKNRQDKKNIYIYSIDMEISFTFLVLVGSSIFISLYI